MKKHYKKFLGKTVEVIFVEGHSKDNTFPTILEEIKNNPQIIEEIARDIEKHFTEHFKDTGLKAQIVAPSKYAAILFQNFF